MKKLNRMGYLTVEIILASAIAFTIAFFLIEVTVNYSDATDNYYTDTLYLTDKALIEDNVKDLIQNNIVENGIITSINCATNTCTLSFNNGSTKAITVNNNTVSYDSYSRKVNNVSFKLMSSNGNYEEDKYIRINIDFDNIYTKSSYDINIIIYNGGVSRETLASYITKLYTKATKTVVTNNSINYNYANDENLMNDRLGGTTTSLDGGNIRYYGNNPNNYVDIGDRDGNNNVIPWRIIGVFTGEVRIIRDKDIWEYSYDTSYYNVNAGRGFNDWRQADIMKLLNPGYDTNIDKDGAGTDKTINNSLWWNSESGDCYNGESNAFTTCDFTGYLMPTERPVYGFKTTAGLSEDSKKYLVDQTLYLGGFDASLFSGSSPRGVYVNEAYTIERNTTNTWTGKVGLIYPSDYGYARNFNGCTLKLNDNYYSTNGNLTDCYYRNWLFYIGEPNEGSATNMMWTISPISNNNYQGIYVETRLDFTDSSSAFQIYPTLTLDADVVRVDGTGAKDDPYTIDL